MTKNLIILGNGFDLHNGLKSSFQDFFNNRKENLSKVYEFAEEIGADSKNIERVGNGLDADEIKLNIVGLTALKINSNLNFDPYANYEKYERISTDKINFWDFYLILLKNDNKNWFDIESQIELFFTGDILGREVLKTSRFDDISNYIEKFRNSTLSRHNNLENFYSFDFMTQVMAFVLVNIFDYDVHQPLTSFLVEQLYHFEETLKVYLGKQAKNEDYLDQAKDCINQLGGQEEFNVLNFNYTQVLLNDSVQTIERNVHGSLAEDGHPIMGIDSNEVSTGKPYFAFTKTYRIMALANGETKKILPFQLDRIVFYGHSLSKADYSYFQSIFDYYSIYDSDVELEFYYSVYSDKTKIEVENEQYDRISKLLEAYGKTIPNHGKNLLHKLLLGNRISIKELHDEGQQNVQED